MKKLSATQHAVRAGFGKVPITPAPGAPLAGFAARTAVSTGVGDELFVRALAVEGKEQPAIVCVADVLALSAGFTAAARHRIEERTGVRAEAVVIAATHTHSGPVTIRTFFNPDEAVDAQYMERLADAIVSAAEAAWESRAAARLGAGAGTVDGIGVNRREPGGPVDREVGVLRVDDVTGRLRGVLFHYACHLTVLGPDNLEISADLGGAAVARVEHECGDGTFAMFVNGAEGNVSFGHSPTLSAIGAAPPRSRAQMCALGERLGDAVVAVLPGIATSEDAAVAAGSTRMRVPLRGDITVLGAQAALERIGARDDQAGRIERLHAAIQLNNARYIARLEGVEEAELAVIAIGDCRLAAVPGELFTETALELKARGAGPLRVVGLANGYLGYIPPEAAFARGGYEVMAARSAPGAAERIADELIGLAQRVGTPAGAVS
jgi:neutral ceramidase